MRKVRRIGLPPWAALYTDVVRMRYGAYRPVAPWPWYSAALAALHVRVTLARLRRGALVGYTN